MTNYLIAHDLGTSGNKATLFNTDGVLIKSVSYSYPTCFFNGTWAEQDPEDWWNAVCKTNQMLLQGFDKSLVAAVAFSGQMMGCVPVDKSGTPLRRAIIWSDQRSQAQEMQLRSQIDEQAFYRIAGHRISASYSIEKLMWIRDNEPDIYKKIHKMLQPKDYIIYRMTGSFVTDFSDASGTNAFDLNKFQWSEHLLSLANIPQDLLPDIYPSTHIVGELSARMADICGLAPGTKVVIGAGDGVCAAVGSGAVKENIAYNYLGSSSWIAYPSRTPFYDSEMQTYNWAHMVPGLITPNGTMQAAGNSYQFLQKILCDAYEIQAKELKTDIYHLIDQAISSSPPGANGLIYLPYLLGERSPRWNANARGAFVGLKMEHAKSDLLRAGIEGVLMNLCLILDLFRTHSKIDHIRIIGGLAKSDIIAQIMADIYGIPIVRLARLEEATSMGAAVAAGVGAGVLPGFDAVDRFIQDDVVFYPNAKINHQYSAVKAVFEQCYQSLLPVYDSLSQL